MLPVLCSLISSVRPAAYRLPRARYLYRLKSGITTHDATTQDFHVVPEGSWTLADEHLTLAYLPLGLSSSADLGCACILPEAIPVLTLDVKDQNISLDLRSLHL